MNSKVNFVADRIIQDKAYPALAQHSARPYTPDWREFGAHYPFTVPVDLHDHCAQHHYPYQIDTLNNFTPGSFYTIAPMFFDHTIDYIGLLPDSVKQLAKQNQLTLLFYYDEGDNPYQIKLRLDQLCINHNLPTTIYRFISANSAAINIPGFEYFASDELLYWQRNQKIPPTPVIAGPRPYNFTILSRTHKWWRATVMTHLHRSGILDQSIWSYGMTSIDDRPEDNPIEIDSFNQLRADIEKFIANAPYTCDMLTTNEHNDHHLHIAEHYTDSYCNIVLETHFDADGSGGTFLTEKTFKPIKHGQPFVIVGPPGSLKQLRDMGYCTFDQAIDNSYDLITNSTDRWRSILNTIQKLQQQDLSKWFESCRAEIEHNQQLFLASKYNRLNSLFERLHND
jgi:hypothetical protein